MLAASRIAADLAGDQLPSAKDLFVLSAAVADAAQRSDASALELAVESVTGLLEELPKGGEWRSCRGHLNAVRELAWLLLHGGPGMAKRPATPSDLRFTLTT
jgi:hypothetical protein